MSRSELAAIADACAALLDRRGPLPVTTLARELRRSPATLTRALRSQARFSHSGYRKGSRWAVRFVPGSVSLHELAMCWRCGTERAELLVSGRGGFVEREILEDVGGDRYRVTARGAELARELASIPRDESEVLA